VRTSYNVYFNEMMMSPLY